MFLMRLKLKASKFKHALLSDTMQNVLLIILNVWMDLIFIYAIYLVLEERSKLVLIFLLPILWIYNCLKKSYYGLNLQGSQKFVSLSSLPGRSAEKVIKDIGDPRDLYIRKIHEAGHAVMAEILGIEIIDISLEPIGNSGGRVILDLPGVQMATELKKRVMINYSGLVAEKLILGGASTGSIGCEDSDIERSNLALKHFVILTDSEISITGYEEEYIKCKSIELSKEWLAEATNLLETNKQRLIEKAESL